MKSHRSIDSLQMTSNPRPLYTSSLRSGLVCMCMRIRMCIRMCMYVYVYVYVYVYIEVGERFEIILLLCIDD